MAHYITDNDLFLDKPKKVSMINSKKAEFIINKRNLSKTEYLYGTKDIENIPEEFINYRISLLNKHLAELFKEHYMIRDTERINKIVKAIKFWQNIKEN